MAGRQSRAIKQSKDPFAAHTASRTSGNFRRGHATTVLAALEELARQAGYTTLRLETGPAQPEAAALYGRRGYRRIPVYGRYPQALAFERDL